MMDADEWVLEGDLDAAREIEETVESAELFLYPGDRHLFADDGLCDYDDAAGNCSRSVWSASSTASSSSTVKPYNFFTDGKDP